MVTKWSEPSLDKSLVKSWVGKLSMPPSSQPLSERFSYQCSVLMMLNLAKGKSTPIRTAKHQCKIIGINTIC